MWLMSMDPRGHDEREEEAGTTFVLGSEGWEAAEYVAPGPDWQLEADGAYASPDGLTRTWPIGAPEVE